jgi:hypothetical protein
VDQNYLESSESCAGEGWVEIQLDRTFKKLRIITQNRGREEYSTDNKKKES